MSPANIPSHLPAYLSSPATQRDAAVDALEEWILHRRAKGDTLFEVSVGLAEIEDKTPPHTGAVFNKARYVTNVPEPHDLTPPTGPFPLSRSQSPASILHHLLSQPPPSLEHSREVILEYVLAREQKAREKKPGRGGKGTIGKDTFEEISARLGEVEDGLRGGATSPLGSPPRKLDSARQRDLALLLSIRLTLSYFTLRELAEQLLVLSVPDAERALLQHIRRRVAGEGRWGVGKELEFVEGLISARPALRPAFRSAKTRTGLAQQANYPITLPAPTKSAVIKLISGFARDVEDGRLSAPVTPSSPSGRYFHRGPTTPTSSSPKTTLAQLPPATTHDPNAVANYALELVSEYLSREKREYMLKAKWAKSGREQLGKDLGDIESAFKTSQILIPMFLVLRRTFALPPSPLSADYIDQYLDILPAPPDPDDVPFREPSVQSTTAALYVNPRMSDEAALVVLNELMENEKERLEGATDEEKERWIREQIDAVAKRFPDGSYAEVFAASKQNILAPLLAPVKPVHRRAQSNNSTPVRTTPVHSRSLSVPLRESLDDSDSETELESPAQVMTARVQPQIITNPYVNGSGNDNAANTHKALPPLQLQSPSQITPASSGPASSGWWDVVSAVQHHGSAPWHERTASGNSIKDLPLPPGAEPAQAVGHVDLARLDLDSPPPPPRIAEADRSPRSSPARDERTTQRAMTYGQGQVSPPAPTPAPGSGQGRAYTSPPHRQQNLPPPMPAQAEPSPTQRTRLFGRSLTLSKPKEEKEGKARKSVTNEPGRWNRDMVANIMGPPADRR